MRFAFILCSLFIMSVSPAFAAPKGENIKLNSFQLRAWEDSVKAYTKQYRKSLNDLQRNPDRLDNKVAILRSYYSRTMQYTPFSKFVLDKLTEHAFTATTSKDSNEVNEALISYNDLLNLHLMNFDVLTFALTMSRIDVRFGNDLFYSDVRKALIKGFFKFNKGKKPDSAHYIVSYGEENYILEDMGGKVTSSEVYKVGGKYYNVHELMSDDGEYQQVFMDVTDPIKNVLYKQKSLEYGNIKPLPRH